MAGFAPSFAYVPAPTPPSSVVGRPTPLAQNGQITLSNGVTLSPMPQPSLSQPPAPIQVQAPVTLQNGVTLTPIQPGQDTLSAPGPGDAVSGAMGAQSGPISPIDDPNKLPPVSATAAASFPKNPAAKAQYLANSLFPNLAPEQAIRRMGFDGSRYYYIADDGKPYYAEPKMAPISDPKTSALESVDWLASGLGPSLPTIGGMAGGIAGGPEPASVIPAAGGAMLGDALRQTGALAFSGERQGLVPGELNALKEGGEAAAGQLAGLALAKTGSMLLDRNPLKVQYYDVKSLTPARVQGIQDNVDLAQSLGIDVTPGEAGKVRSLLANQRQLLRMPESSTPLSDFYENRNLNQLPNAFDNVLGQISPNGATAVANRDFGTAAADTITSARQARSALAQGLYQKAYAANPSVATPQLDRILETPAGSAALKSVATDMQNGMTLMGPSDPELTALKNELVSIGQMGDPGSKGVASGLKLQTYDLIKQKLWDMEQAAKGPNGEATFSSTNIGKLRTALTNELDKADSTASVDSQGNPVPGLYARARKLYETNSPEVNNLQNGIVGLVAQPKAASLQNLPKTMFSAQTANPFQITQAKAAYAKAGQTDQWNAGLRSFLQNTWDQAVKQGGDAGPAGSLWKSIAGDRRQMANLKAALGPTQYQALDDFMTVAKMVSRAPAEGSATATDIGARGRMAGPVAKGISAVIRGVDPFNIPGDVAAKISDISSGKNAEALANLITNPQATAMLRKLRVLSPTSKQFIQQIGAFGALIGGNSAKSTLYPGQPQAPGSISGPGATQ